MPSSARSAGEMLRSSMIVIAGRLSADAPHPGGRWVGRTGRLRRLWRNAAYLDGPHARGRERPVDVDAEQAILEPSAGDLQALGQHEAALELARGDAAMEIDVAGLLRALPADDELIVLDGHLELALREAGDRERDAQCRFAQLLD